MDRKRIVRTTSLVVVVLLAHSLYSRYRAVCDPIARRQFLENSSHFVVLSLDSSPLGGGFIGETAAQRKKRTTVEDHENFQGARILQEVEITNPTTKKRLLEALYRGVRGDGFSGALCFSPRHGIRATSGLTTVDLNICFQCSAIKVSSGLFSDRIITTKEPQEAFNSTLSEAEIPSSLIR